MGSIGRSGQHHWVVCAAQRDSEPALTHLGVHWNHLLEDLFRHTALCNEMLFISCLCSQTLMCLITWKCSLKCLLSNSILEILIQLGRGISPGICIVFCFVVLNKLSLYFWSRLTWWCFGKLLYRGSPGVWWLPPLFQCDQGTPAFPNGEHEGLPTKTWFRVLLGAVNSNSGLRARV